MPVLQSDFTGAISRLMKFPPVENVLWLFERAVKIRDSPQTQKPVPINLPPSSISPPQRPANSSPQKKVTAGEKFKRKTVPVLNSMAHTTAKVVASVPRPSSLYHSSDHHDTEKDQLREELYKLKQMNFLLGEQIQKGVVILHQELLTSPEKPNTEAVLLAMAGIKQAKDILCGNLPFDPKVLQINDQAFNSAAHISTFTLLSLNFAPET